MSLRKRLAALAFVLFFSVTAFSKEPPGQVMIWPESGTQVVRFTFGKFKDSGSYGNQHSYSSEITAENLWGKPISHAEFSLYLFDKNKVRIGEAWISLTNVGVGQTIKFQTSFATSGSPVSVQLVPRSLPNGLESFLPAKTVSITVNSVPQGALLRVDGTEAGTTPKRVEVRPGKHILEFSKEGFTAGKFPLEIGADDVSGGSVSYELGTAAHDTIELRDGSVLTGDVESLSATEALVRIGGSMQHLNRNQVKRIVLVEREMPQ